MDLEAPGGSAVAYDLARPSDPGYSSPQSRSRWVVAFFKLTIALHVLLLVVLGAQISLISRGQGQVPLSQWHTTVSLMENFALLGLLLVVVTAVSFFLWLHRCYFNLTVITAGGLRFTPGWAVGYWFIPILNIVRSKQVLDELWRFSASPAGVEMEKKPLTAFWLAALVVAGLTTRGAIAMHPATLGDLKTVKELLVVSNLTDIVAAVLILRLVRTVTAWQGRWIPA